MNDVSAPPNPSSIALGHWLVPPVLRYVAGRGDRVYVLLSGVDGGSGHSACGIVRSDDAGRTWSEPSVIATSLGVDGAHPGAPSAGWAAHALAVDASDVDKVYVTLESRTESERRVHLAVSRDGAATFDLVELASSGHQALNRYHVLQEFVDVASVAADVVGIATIMPKVPFDVEAPPDLVYWRVDERTLPRREATEKQALAPTAVLPFDGSGRTHSARIVVEGGRVRVFHASVKGIHFHESVDEVPFGEARAAELANRCLSDFDVSKAGRATLLLSGGGSNMFAATPVVLHVAADGGLAFEPRELGLGDGAGKRVRIEIAGRTGPCLLSGSAEDGTRLFLAQDGGERFASVLLEGRAYRAYQAHDTGQGLVVVARGPSHWQEDRTESAEACVAFRVGFGADALSEGASVEVVPLRARGQSSPSFDEWLGLRPVLVLSQGKELDAMSTTVSRVGGPAIGVRVWPASDDGEPMQHILTLDLRGRRGDGGPAAIALFAALCDDFGQALFRVIELSEADLADPKPMAFPGEDADSRLAVPSELLLDEPTEWSDCYVGGQACYVQGGVLEPTGSAEDLAQHVSLLRSMGEFVCQFGASLFPGFDFGDGGIVYIHRRGAWLEMC